MKMGVEPLVELTEPFACRGVLWRLKGMTALKRS
jgi:hypothetical protein